MISRMLVRVSSLLGTLASAATAVLMLVVVADVIARNVTGASIGGVIELAETTMVIAVFFGLAITMVEGQHIELTMVVERLSARLANRIRLVVWVLTSATAVWMSYATAVRAVDSTVNAEARFGLVHWPLAPARWAICIGLVAIAAVSIVNLVRSFRGLSELGAEFRAEPTHEDSRAES